MAIEVDILGSKYSIVKSDKTKDAALESLSGYCDPTVNKIVIDTFKPDTFSKEDLEKYENEVIRHELIHAFLTESGLSDSSWAANEEIVDWFAIQSPKILKVFEELNVI